MTTESGNENNTKEDAAAAEAEQQAANLRKFEKFFRLLDSDQEGEAEAAFRQARKALPKIGLTFGDILDMLDNTGGYDEAQVQALIAEYKAANDQLKAAEDIIISENTRLNFLLRNLRDADPATANIDANTFKKDLVSVIEKVSAVNKDMSSITLPENQQELEEIYKLRMAEALMPHKAHITKGLFDRLVVWGMRRVDRDGSMEDLLKLQDLVTSQEKVIEDQSSLLNEMKDIQKRGLEISEKLDLVVSASAPQSVYNEALRQLKEAQLLLGDGQDVKTLQSANEKLTEAVQSLAQEKNKIAHRAAVLEVELEEAKLFTPMSSNTGSQTKASGKKAKDTEKTAPKAGAAPEPKTINPERLVDSTEYKLMESQVGLQQRQIQELQLELTHNKTHALLSAQDLLLVEKLDLYKPLLSSAMVKLDAAITVIQQPQEEKSAISRFFASLFGRKDKSRQKVLEAAHDIQTIVDTVNDAGQLIHKLSTTFNAEAQALEASVEATIEKQLKQTLSLQKSTYSDASKKFAASLNDSLEEQRDYFKNAERNHQESITNLEKLIKETKKNLKNARQEETLYNEELRKSFEENAEKSDDIKKTDVEVVQKVLNRLMFEAVERSNIDKANVMVQKGADVNSRNTAGDTLLMRAIRAESTAMVQFLLEKDVDIFAQTKDERSIFEYVQSFNWNSKNARDVITQQLMQAIPDAPSKAEPAKKTEAEVLTEEQKIIANRIMITGVRQGNRDLFDLGMKKGADINCVTDNGYTALMYASILEGYNIIDAVLETNPDITFKNESGKDVFDIINARSWNKSSNREEMVRKIVSALPDTEAPKPVVVAFADAAKEQQGVVNAVFIMGFESGNKTVMDAALAKGANVNMKDVTGRTPLLVAVKRERADMVGYLLTKNPDLFQKDADGNTVFDLLKQSWNSSSAKQRIMEDLLLVLPDKVQKPKAKASKTGGPGHTG